MSPELLVRMFETTDNVTMVEESAGDLSRMRRIDKLSGGRLRFYLGGNPLAWHALRAGAAGWCTAAPCLRPRPCIELYNALRTGELPRAQAIYADVKPPLEFIVAAGPPTTVTAGPDLDAVGVGDSRRPLLPLEDKGREALKKLLTDG